MLDRYFRFTEHNTNVRTELLAGLTTFLTMAYIIFLQPAILSGQFFGTPNGMALGFISYPLIKLLFGQGRDVKWLMYVMAVLLAVYMVTIRGWIG